MARDDCASAPKIRVIRIDPCLDESVKLCCLLENFLSLGFRRNVRARVVDHVPLSTASLEIVGVFARIGADAFVNEIWLSVIASKATLW